MGSLAACTCLNSIQGNEVKVEDNPEDIKVDNQNNSQRSEKSKSEEENISPEEQKKIDEEIKMMKKKKKRCMRSSVSAEVIYI